MGPILIDYGERFKASFARVFDDEALRLAFAERFYEIFTGQGPAIAERFSGTDISVQRERLLHALQALVAFDEHRQLTPELRRLAAIHSRARQDIPAELYDPWMDALIAAVAEFDSNYDEDTGLAWRLVLSPGVACLCHFYGR